MARSSGRGGGGSGGGGCCRRGRGRGYVRLGITRPRPGAGRRGCRRPYIRRSRTCRATSGCSHNCRLMPRSNGTRRGRCAWDWVETSRSRGVLSALVEGLLGGVPVSAAALGAAQPKCRFSRFSRFCRFVREGLSNRLLDLLLQDPGIRCRHRLNRHPIDRETEAAKTPSTSWRRCSRGARWRLGGRCESCSCPTASAPTAGTVPRGVCGCCRTRPWSYAPRHRGRRLRRDEPRCRVTGRGGVPVLAHLGVHRVRQHPPHRPRLPRAGSRPPARP